MLQQLRAMAPVADSPAAVLLHGSLPGVWTPLTPLSKAAAVRVLFSTFALRFYEPEQPPPPPPTATCVSFRAHKRYEVRWENGVGNKRAIIGIF